MQDLTGIGESEMLFLAVHERSPVTAYVLCPEKTFLLTTKTNVGSNEVTDFGWKTFIQIYQFTGHFSTANVLFFFYFYL